MKKGSQAIRCDTCGKIIGWIVPTEERATVLNLPVVEYRLKPEGKKLADGHYKCATCMLPTDITMKEYKEYYDRLLRKNKKKGN